MNPDQGWSMGRVAGITVEIVFEIAVEVPDVERKMLAAFLVSESRNCEVAESRWQARSVGMLETAAGKSVDVMVTKLFNRDHSQIVPPGEFFQFIATRHRPVMRHDFANHGRRCQTSGSGIATRPLQRRGRTAPPVR